MANSAFKDGQPITLKGPSGSVTLTATASRYPQVPTQILVAPEVMNQLGGTPQPTSIWVGLTDRNQMAAAMQPLMQLQARYATAGLAVSGAAFLASVMEQVLNVLLIATSALLGVAVVIALVGVSNTLGLSVIERGRESALLRALGMQRRSLRLMLLMEALLLALAGVVVGILAGAFFGWLGVNSIMRQAGLTGAGHPTLFALNVWQTVALVVIAVAAAALASILPGRRAAMAPPTEALAEE
jgi:putative ABC transport system permease protein